MDKEIFHEKAPKCEHSFNVQGATEVLGCKHKKNRCEIIFLGEKIVLCNPHTCPELREEAYAEKGSVQVIREPSKIEIEIGTNFKEAIREVIGAVKAENSNPRSVRTLHPGKEIQKAFGLNLERAFIEKIRHQ